jgi:hypothetical protein
MSDSVRRSDLAGMRDGDTDAMVLCPRKLMERNKNFLSVFKMWISNLMLEPIDQ